MILDYLTSKERKCINKKSLKKGEILFNEGEECLYVGIVITGSLSIISYSYKGKEILFNQIFPGDLFGNNLIFSSDPYYKGSVVADTNTVLYLIAKEKLIELLQNNKQFLINYLEIQSNFGKSLNAKIKLLSFDSAEERFLYYLYINNNKITFSNVSSLSRKLSLERETVSRLISKLVKEQKIQRNNNEIILI